MDFGKQLLEFRAKHNLTQTQLASVVGVTPITIQRYENNKFKPSAMRKIRIENILKEWENRNVEM